MIPELTFHLFHCDLARVQLYYSKLPEHISNKVVILTDAVVATANNVVMAIHVLLDHGVKEGS